MINTDTADLDMALREKLAGLRLLPIEPCALLGPVMAGIFSRELARLILGENSNTPASRRPETD